jgi:segregation and condensation protein B
MTTYTPHDTARMIEALVFASALPVTVDAMAERLPAGADIAAGLEVLQQKYAGGGVELALVFGGWRLQTAADLSHLLVRERTVQRPLSKAALETLAIIAYHQPVTRAEIEDIRGVSITKGVLDTLMEIGWVKIRGRRQSPGRPVTYGVTPAFLQHFGLGDVSDLPGAGELKAMGLLDADIPSDFDPLQLELRLRGDEMDLTDEMREAAFVEDFLDDADKVE